MRSFVVHVACLVRKVGLAGMRLLKTLCGSRYLLPAHVVCIITLWDSKRSSRPSSSILCEIQANYRHPSLPLYVSIIITRYFLYSELPPLSSSPSLIPRIVAQGPFLSTIIPLKLPPLTTSYSHCYSTCWTEVRVDSTNIHALARGTPSCLTTLASTLCRWLAVSRLSKQHGSFYLFLIFLLPSFSSSLSRHTCSATHQVLNLH